ncbi:MAG: ABC transporter substrate-binding protein, partial [Synergistaceae bacterium]|nr:ABC transporter substrate-binding protein [Synergistaceae bacterium]
MKALRNTQTMRSKSLKTASALGKAVLCCLLLILLIVPAAFAEGEADKKSADGVVEFKYPEWVYYDLIYLAEDLGYFKDAKVRPKYVGQVAAGQMIPALTTGDLDVANRHTPLVIAAIASGADVKVFAAGSKSTQRDPHMKYFVRADSPIKTIKDFQGKTLGINSFGACSEYVTKKYSQDNGVDPTSIKMITAPDSEQEVP